MNYIGEWQTNVSGGVSRGSEYIGRLEGVIDIDMAKLARWRGWAFHINAYQIQGNGLSREHVFNLMPVSYIEALANTRLAELWLEHKLFDDKLSVRLGQMAADNEFNTSLYATQFINNTFGWPTILSADLPSSGPAYPFATPGVRAKLDPVKSMSILLGVFNGDPAGPEPGDPEKRDPHSELSPFFQQIWRPKTGEPDKGIGVFARASASPADRNLVDLYIDGGIVFAGLIPFRPDDVLSFGGAYARISDRARGLDSDAIALGGGGIIRDFEALFEVNYQAQVVPGLQIDLDLQRIIQPGGSIAGPNGVAIPDATVVTFHTSIKY